MTDLSITVQGAAGALKRVDRVWLVLGLLSLGLSVFLPSQAWDSALFILDAVIFIFPFMAVSVLLAAWLKAAGADTLIGAAISRSPVRAIFIAAAAGAFSPFCSCGVVPLIAALLAAGVPLPAVMAFWVSSPIMDPEMFVLMWASLGLEFTLAKTVAALGLGMAGGFATLLAQRAGWFQHALRPQASGCGSSCSPSLSSGKAHWIFWREGERRSLFASEARTVGLFLAKWLLLAFMIESFMVVWLPQELVASYLGGQTGMAIPLSVIAGVPAYLNGYAAIPLVGELMSMGMAPGAALAFLVAGGVTSVPAAMAVFALVKRQLFLWYLVIAMVGSLAIGYGYQAILAF